MLAFFEGFTLSLSVLISLLNIVFRKDSDLALLIVNDGLAAHSIVKWRKTLHSFFKWWAKFISYAIVEDFSRSKSVACSGYSSIVVYSDSVEVISYFLLILIAILGFVLLLCSKILFIETYELCIALFIGLVFHLNGLNHFFP